jgi:hypothetical protein
MDCTNIAIVHNIALRDSTRQQIFEEFSAGSQPSPAKGSGVDFRHGRKDITHLSAFIAVAVTVLSVYGYNLASETTNSSKKS